MVCCKPPLQALSKRARGNITNEINYLELSEYCLKEHPWAPIFNRRKRHSQCWKWELHNNRDTFDQLQSVMGQVWCWSHFCVKQTTWNVQGLNSVFAEVCQHAKPTATNYFRETQLHFHKHTCKIIAKDQFIWPCSSCDNWIYLLPSLPKGSLLGKCTLPNPSNYRQAILLYKPPKLPNSISSSTRTLSWIRSADISKSFTIDLNFLLNYILAYWGICYFRQKPISTCIGGTPRNRRGWLKRERRNSSFKWVAWER